MAKYNLNPVDVPKVSTKSRLTGINVKQLNHYATGKSKPCAQQVRKIESGLHKLGSELLQIQL